MTDAATSRPPSLKHSLAQAAQAIGAASHVVLATHFNPDGDTLGSALALSHAITALGKRTTVLSSDGVPEIYRWMPGQDRVLRQSDQRDYDLAVVVDTGTLDRVGNVRAAIESAPRSIDVDHHLAEGIFGDIRVVDAKAAATGELIYLLIRELRVSITPQIADCLMCAIVTDTGSFQFLNVTPRTLRIAAALMRCGARLSAIGELVFEDRSLASVKLLGRALDSLRVSADGRVAWAHLRAGDFEELGATDEETEGIANHIRAVRGTQVGIFFREIPGKKVRISLRAKEGFDVNRVAQAFDGGGHMLAAGCTLKPPLEEAERLVLAEIQRQMVGDS